MRAIRGVIRGGIACLSLAACGAEAPPPAGPPPLPPPPPLPSVLPGAGERDAGAQVENAAPSDKGASGEAASAKASACPAGMALVDTTYCPKVELNCLRSEYDKPNHLTICHEFAPGQKCLGGERRQRFCIDAYEYPNKAGAHPPVMVDWYDAAAACGAEGKRLCWESEWVAACEGPKKLPFPYGLKRDPNQCNIENPYIKPDLDRVYAAKPEVQSAELLKLDQGVASGEKPGCVSGFGVHDLTGNFDEWVSAESTYKKSKWAGLKGGAWGHVRNACRPMTTSHPPEFTYYFISFRCCADAAPDPEAARDPKLWTPPPPPAQKKPGPVSRGWTTTERGPNRPGGKR